MLAGSFDTSSLKERILYQQQQVEKWNKIFRELEAYMDEHTAMVVYDFSEIKDKIDMSDNTVSITVAPGIKAFPNRDALSVWKTALDEWIAVRSNEENKDWIKQVRAPVFGFTSGTVLYNLNYEYRITVGLYNEDEELLEKVTIIRRPSIYVRVWTSDHSSQISSPQLKSQKTYFAEADTHKVYFRVPISRISSELTVKLVDDIDTRVSTGKYRR